VLIEVAYLIVAFNQHAVPVGFMGVENQRLEMLFITPEERGKGLGKELLQRGIQNYVVNELTVNEQNPQAKGFYEHMGFKVYKRTDIDELGNPYPLLYMRL
jgi:putative acetyltransferase